MRTSDALREIIESISAGNAGKVRGKVRSALQKGAEPARIITDGIVKAMDVVSKKFERSEIYVADLITTARAIHAGMEELKPYMVSGQVQTVGRAVIGTVYGDIHDIGKNLLGILLEASGFEVVDLGVNVAPSSFVEAVIKHRPHVLGLSALLTSTLKGMEDTIEALEDAGLRQKVKVVVGGAPLTTARAAKMGADAYAPDVTVAIPLIKELIGAGQKRVTALLPATMAHFLGEGSLEELQKSFGRLSGLHLVILDAHGNLLSSPGRFFDCSGFCRALDGPGGGVSPFGEDLTALAGRFKRAFVYRCRAGLVEISYPLANEDGMVGAILSGHCLLSGDRPAWREEPADLPVLSVEELEAVCGLLSFIAGQIVQLNAVLVAKQEVEEDRNGFIHFLKNHHQLEQALGDAELRALQSQVGPHFLFNSLNAIARLALFEAAPETEKMVRALARLMRYTLYQVKSLVTVREELAVVQDYLFIQQTRFCDRLTSEIDVDQALMEARLPCMTLQPLVENAVIHGLEPLKEGGGILVKGRLCGEQVCLEVIDTGLGIPEELQKEIFDLDVRSGDRGQVSGLGIINVFRRLQHYFGADCTLNVQSGPGAGTTIQLTFPFSREEGRGVEIAQARHCRR
ncbi:MAG TPA: cobalamin-dependent protein [Spirochaetia bacterium]|nr:cobalamin-dependent protein [Spirochaetia bacterium]